VGLHIARDRVLFSLAKYPRAQLDGRMHGVCPLPYNLHTHRLGRSMMSSVCIVILLVQTMN
jgi:hypothetical protein